MIVCVCVCVCVCVQLASLYTDQSMEDGKEITFASLKSAHLNFHRKEATHQRNGAKGPLTSAMALEE